RGARRIRGRRGARPCARAARAAARALPLPRALEGRGRRARARGRARRRGGGRARGPPAPGGRRPSPAAGALRAARLENRRNLGYLRAMAVRAVLQFPDRRLKRVSEPVERVTDEIRELARDMLEVMYDEPGIGLAAPQLGVPLRLIVVDVHWNEEGGERNPRVLVNPEIVESSGTITWNEGGLSGPALQPAVSRPGPGAR